MIKRKKRMQLLICLLVLFLAAACSSGGTGTGTETNASESPPPSSGGETAQELKIGIANITGTENSWSLNLEKVGEELEAKSNGRITVDLYPGGQLGNEVDMMQQLNAGSLQMAAITMAQLSASSPAFNAWMMPYLVEDHDQAYELMTSQEALDLFQTLTTDNVVGLGYVSGGFRNLVSTSPIESVEDIRNFKLRTTPSPLILDFWQNMGATPTQMPLTEVFSAMQTGVIAGLETDTESLVTENLMEEASYLVYLNHMYWVGGIMINKDFWNSLSADDQQLIKDAVATAMEYNLGIVKDREAEFETVATEKFGLQVSPFDAKAAFEPFIDQFRTKWMEQSKSPEFDAFMQKAIEIAGKGE